MGKGRKHVVTAKKRGIANGDKRAERQAYKAGLNNKRYGKACNYSTREEQNFALMLDSLGLQVKVMQGDGNCMFRAIADQVFGSSVGHMDIRLRLVNYMVKEKDIFSLFIEDDEPFKDYIDRMR